MTENLSGRNVVAFLSVRNNGILAIGTSTPVVHKSNQRSGFLFHNCFQNEANYICENLLYLKSDLVCMGMHGQCKYVFHIQI